MVPHPGMPVTVVPAAGSEPAQHRYVVDLSIQATKVGTSVGGSNMAMEPLTFEVSTSDSNGNRIYSCGLDSGTSGASPFGVMADAGAVVPNGGDTIFLLNDFKLITIHGNVSDGDHDSYSGVIKNINGAVQASISAREGLLDVNLKTTATTPQCMRGFCVSLDSTGEKLIFKTFYSDNSQGTFMKYK